jgi:hypothetical protein
MRPGRALSQSGANIQPDKEGPMSTTLSSSGRARPDEPTNDVAPGLVRHLTLTTRATVVASVLGAGVACARIPLAVPADDTQYHRFLPLGMILGGLVMLGVATRAANQLPLHRAGRDVEPVARWIGFLSLVALLQSIHGLVLGSLSYALTPAGGALPLHALAWMEDWTFILADGAFAGLLVLALPVTRRHRAWSRAVRGGGILLTLGALSNMVTPRSLNNPAGMHNPLGVHGLEPLAGLGIGAYLAVTLLGMVLATGRTLVGSLGSDRARRPSARWALAAAMTVLAFFVFQAAGTPHPSVGQGVASALTFVVVTACVAVLGARAVASATS